MARVSESSIPQSQTPEQGGTNHYVRRCLTAMLRNLRADVERAATICDADRYRKSFFAFSHFCLLLFHGFSGNQSLRQSYGVFGLSSGLVELSGLGTPKTPQDSSLSVSFSQFADSNTTRSADFLGLVVSSLMKQVFQQGLDRSNRIPSSLRVLDSTHLKLSMKLASWLPDRSGVRVQCQYAPAFDLPERICVTDTRTNDCQGIDQAILKQPLRLARLRGQTFVIDLGYYSHRRFQRLMGAKVHFVSRLRTQVCIHIEEDIPVQAPLFSSEEYRIQIVHDQRVTLGSPNNRASAVLHGMRLVTAVVAPNLKAKQQGAQPITYQLTTDRWDLSAKEVVEIYLHRWKIELFFRWLKSHIRLSRLLGYSSNAVHLSIWLALLVHLLTLLMMHKMNQSRRSPKLLRTIHYVLAHLSAEDIWEILPLPVQLSLGMNLPPQVPT